MYTDNVCVFKSDVHQAEVWCLPTSRPTALAQGWTGHRCERCLFQRLWGHTVDGRNPAPVDMVVTPLFTGFYTSEVVVWDFFNQQHCWYRQHRKSLTSGNFVTSSFWYTLRIIGPSNGRGPEPVWRRDPQNSQFWSHGILRRQTL